MALTYQSIYFLGKILWLVLDQMKHGVAVFRTMQSSEHTELHLFLLLVKWVTLKTFDIDDNLEYCRYYTT